MAEQTKDQLRLTNQTNFPNNNTGFITPDKLRDFNNDMIDSIATTADSASFSNRVTHLENFSSSLDDDFVSETQFNAYTSSVTAVSASNAVRVTNLENFSSSLDATFVNETEFGVYTASVTADSASVSTRVTNLENFSSSLTTDFVSTTDFQTFSGSVSSSLDNLQDQIDGLVTSGSGIVVKEEGTSLGTATSLNFVGASVTASLVGADATITVNATAVDVSGLATTASLNAYTASNDSRVDSLEAETGSLQTQIDSLTGVTGSYATTSSLESVSSSLASRVTTNEGNISTNTSDIADLRAETGSYATTGSNTFEGNQTINGDLVVNGTGSFDVFITNYQSSSIIYSSGSTKFGDTLDDTHEFTGSVTITGSLTALDGVQNLTASWAVNALTASYVENAGTSSFSTYSDNTIVYGKNISGGTIEKGTPLYFTGSGTAGNIVGLFPADAGNPDRMPAGGVAGEQILDEAEGIVLLDGFINGVNTSTFASGDKVYVGVGGGYTNVEPTGSNFIQYLGNVEKSAVNGSGVIQMMGEARRLPNLNSGSVWVGDNDSVPQSIATSSLDVATAVSASHSVNSDTAISASHALNADTSISASHAVQADNATTADSATTATTATTASYVLGSNVDGAVANATNAVSASHAVQADNATTADSATTAGTATTASYVAGANVDGQVASALSSSYAITASYAENAAPTFPYTGSAQITGSLGVTGSIDVVSGSYSGSVVDNVSVSVTNVPEVKHIVSITSASYSALGTKDPNTLYVITGSIPYVTAFPYTGSADISGSLNVNGTISSTETALLTSSFAITASYAENATSDFPFTGSAQITGSLGITGSVIGNVVSVAEVSATASIDLSKASFFSSSIDNDTHISVTNVQPGQTAMLRVTIANPAPAVTFSPNVLQPSGSEYTPSADGSIDILTFASFDSSTVSLVAVNKLI